MASKKFIQALDLLESERGIKKEVVLDALKEALEKSYKKNYLGTDSVVRVEINEKTGKIRLFEIKTVVEDLENEDFEIELEEAREINPKYQVGDEIVTEVSPEVFGRLAAIQTKQLLKQKIREAEKESLFNEYVDKKDDIITGIVDKIEERFAIINIGKTGALLPINQQIPGEKLYDGQHIKVYVSDVERNTKGTHIAVSRTEPGLVKRLFEMEVPEIFDGIVEIKSVSREPGERSKIAVYTSNENVDPIGACVGPKGTRVNNVVNELNGEKIDIIEWDKDPIVYISHALAPAVVKSVKINEDNHTAFVIVPDNQLSLAIGKRGQNARLAVRLTGWKIDIKSESEVIEAGLNIEFDDKEFAEEFEKEMTAQEDVVTETVVEEIVQDVKEIGETVVEEVVEEVETVVENEEVFDDDEESFDNDDYDTEDYDYDEDDDDYDYDPKYDEDIDYDEYDKYYDDK